MGLAQLTLEPKQQRNDSNGETESDRLAQHNLMLIGSRGGVIQLLQGGCCDGPV